MRARIVPRKEICGNSGLPIPMVWHLHQSIAYIKRKLQVWRAQNCIALLGAKTVLTSAGPQTSRFHEVSIVSYRNGNLWKFGSTYPHGTVFTPKQCLYQKEPTCMESPRMHCPSRCKNRTYQYGAINYPVSCGAV